MGEEEFKVMYFKFKSLVVIMLFVEFVFDVMIDVEGVK